MIPTREAFIAQFVKELTNCRGSYISVHEDDTTDWTAKELGSLAHDVLVEMQAAA